MNLHQIKEKYSGQVPTPLVSIAHDLGIEIYEVDNLKDSECGSISNEGGKFVIYVNAKHPSTRKRFTVAHELAHFFNDKEKLKLNQENEHIDSVKQPVSLHRDNDREMTQEEKKIEIEANKLAADILMPEQEFKAEWSRTATIEELAEKFQVSTSAAAIRASTLLGCTTF